MIDGIMLSHLHGDHFGGLPFLLLDAQFLARRERPLLIAGPPGTRARLDAAAGSVLSELDQPTSGGFPGRWWRSRSAAPTEMLGHAVDDRRGRALVRRAVDRGAALRRREAVRLFGRHRMDRGAASASPTAPTSSSANATAMPAQLTGHLSWEILKPRLPDLRARRIMVTHMNPSMLAHRRGEGGRAARRRGRPGDRVLSGAN